jgi:hypothetical protein
VDRGSILAGVKAGCWWIAESADVDLTFTVSAGSRSAGRTNPIFLGRLDWKGSPGVESAGPGSGPAELDALHQRRDVDALERIVEIPNFVVLRSVRADADQC